MDLRILLLGLGLVSGIRDGQRTEVGKIDLGGQWLLDGNTLQYTEESIRNSSRGEPVGLMYI
jgi:hypothetical protein